MNNHPHRATVSHENAAVALREFPSDPRPYKDLSKYRHIIAMADGLDVAFDDVKYTKETKMIGFVFGNDHKRYRVLVTRVKTIRLTALRRKE